MGDTGRPPQSGKAVAFDNIASASHAEKHLLINGDRFATFTSTGRAKEAADVINKAVKATADERELSMRSFVQRQFDAELVGKMLGRLSIAHSLEIACAVMFIFLFVISPMLTIVFGLTPLLVPLALIMILGAAVISIIFFTIHKALYPALKEERISHVAKMMFCPPGAIRATQLLTANLLEGFSPVVVADVLGAANKADFLRSFVRDLMHPLRHGLSDPLSIEIMEWFRDQQLQLTLKYLDGCHDTVALRLFLSEQKDESLQTYCPRCESAFSVNGGECPACPGVRLLHAAAEAT